MSYYHTHCSSHAHTAAVENILNSNPDWWARTTIIFRVKVDNYEQTRNRIFTWSREGTYTQNRWPLHGRDICRQEHICNEYSTKTSFTYSSSLPPSEILRRRIQTTLPLQLYADLISSKNFKRTRKYLLRLPWSDGAAVESWKLPSASNPRKLKATFTAPW